MLHTNDTYDIKEYKDRFGHYYSSYILNEITGLIKYDNYYHIPTYKTKSNKVIEYYNSLIEDFCKLYRYCNLPAESFINHFTKSIGWWDHRKEWHHMLQPQHITILNFIKNGNINGLRDINNQGYNIGFYKDCMLKVAIDNEQIESINYLIQTKQINRDIEEYLENTTPQFYDILVNRYHIKFMQKYKNSPEDTDKTQLYLYYSNLHWIDPEETYLNLKYSRSSWNDYTDPLKSSDTNPKLLSHIIQKYTIDEKHMCTIIKQLKNSNRYIGYCFRNNKISDLKYFFETEYLENKWNQSQIFKIMKACIYYNCIEILDSIRIIKTYEYDTFNYETNLKFYKNAISKQLDEVNDTNLKLEIVSSDIFKTYFL